MKIWRGIFLNNIGDLDIERFGVHWTIDRNYPWSIEFFYNNISKNTRIGNKLFIFEAEIEEVMINTECTQISNRKYSSESEITLKQNVIIRNVKLINQEIRFETIINTGNRAESWTEQIKANQK